MCLGIPGKVVSIKGDHALIDYGGVTREANISLVDAKEGDYVIVHAGFAIEILDKEEAEKTIELWKELISSK
ncbi:MAG: HypC/HybG/HupF family hydrogenase formation chaperone [Thermoplasmata archaeon]|jgi:hydrogenase expression/formation protein HypC|nr:HypC/HybG/HupF family hydrogenase formation chaperone [Thermoplasmata archaeon]MVT13055.1 HypC/HybG/HupF family hydrogenase formation chaperone [Euryarchaeota archaeon]MVT14984.1 HypC/HybG/HupF family hydrogenase formation chaperone [Euryarchaeota archaeon]MVT36116.1 HypC/HybG/HupF family hydrogenase formation chaperone [Euryarchaeota archaeon]